MKKIHGKMMKGITVRSLMMLLALAGSNYCHALQATPAKNAEEAKAQEAKAQATIVVNNPTSNPPHGAYLSEHERGEGKTGQCSP